ncbi:MAG: class I SAM-dependent methyltransferase [Acidimicrobiales bacterium]
MEMTGQQERWQLVGTAAEVYQQRLVPAIFEPWAPLVVDAASLHPGERVLDVACGTGVVAREAARRVASQGTVVGLDNNASMLDVARAIPSTPATSIEWREADAMAMPFPEAAFDVVLCQLGLQYFVDRLAVLREMRRVLTDDGRLVVLVWQSIEGSPGFALLAEALQRHVGTQAVTIMRAPFGLGDPDELRATISEGGFHDVSVRAAEGTVRFPSARHFVEYSVAGSPLAGPVGEATDGAREALVRDVEAAMRPYQTNQGLAFPIAAHLATAHA